MRYAVAILLRPLSVADGAAQDTFRVGGDTAGRE